jgi:hypothetical protein
MGLKTWSFYQYTAEADISLAMSIGFARGIVPLQVIPDEKDLRKSVFRYMQQICWMTKNPRFIPLTSEEGPPRSSLLPGRKAQCRMEVKIPEGFRSNIVRWTTLAPRLMAVDEKVLGPNGEKQISLHKAMHAEINKDIGDPREWWLYGGIIPFSWISDVRYNPSIPRPTVHVSSDVVVSKIMTPDVNGHDGKVDENVVTRFPSPGAE